MYWNRYKPKEVSPEGFELKAGQSGTFSGSKTYDVVISNLPIDEFNNADLSRIS